MGGITVVLVKRRKNKSACNDFSGFFSFYRARTTIDVNILGLVCRRLEDEKFKPQKSPIFRTKLFAKRERWNERENWKGKDRITA